MELGSGVEKIYFDMDGVLADFDRGVRDFCGIEPGKQGDRNDAADTSLWERVKKVDHFYDRLELVPGAKELFDMVYAAYGERCEILTGIPRPHRGLLNAAEDKVKWVRRLLSEDVVVNTVFRAEKVKFCHGSGCILIDDYEKNIAEWEASGGTGVLFTSVPDVIGVLKDKGIQI